MNVRFAPTAGVTVTLTLTRLPPRSLRLNDRRACLESPSVTVLRVPAVSVVLLVRNFTLPALAAILTLPVALALRRNDTSPSAAALALEALNVGFGATV